MIQRLSRAQTMDVLSSQANIAGYRAVLEAARLYGRFFPMMMTSAGFAKPTRGVVLGAAGGRVQALSPEALKKQQHMLQQELKKADVIISTALIPCMPAPVLITEEAVQGMHEG